MRLNLLNPILKAVFILIFFTATINKSLSQSFSQIHLGNDTVICSGATITLHAYIDSPQIGPRLFYPGVWDDYWSGVINMPFPFTFYGNTYNQCLVGSNNEIGFNLAYAGLYNTWPINTTLPDTTPADLMNTIMGPWQDIEPGAANPPGLIRTGTYGTAPNRIFYAEYVNVPMFSCTSDGCFTDQIQLWENGIIETHI